MKIKMVRHYHGKLNGREHWEAGTEHTVKAEVGEDLVERGFAEEVKPKKTTKKTSSKSSK